ncbi:element excision factor XisI family protein [Hydrocoleum sp. CS-953]|uniref:element excision factor XisI family protein n=1 Tax=Hydrocoleum sp. CS-953 TaxID=1671698 RepID=UPI00268AB519
MLEKYAQFQSENKEVENQLFFDRIRNHYQLMRVGWKNLERIYYTVLHFDLKDGKIWLQQNATESNVGQ